MLSGGRCWRHYRQQRILLEPELQTLASRFLLPGEAFLLMCCLQRGALRQRPHDVGVWLGTGRLGRWGPAWWWGGAGEASRKLLWERRGLARGALVCRWKPSEPHRIGHVSVSYGYKSLCNEPPQTRWFETSVILGSAGRVCLAVGLAVSGVDLFHVCGCWGPGQQRPRRASCGNSRGT